MHLDPVLPMYEMFRILVITLFFFLLLVGKCLTLRLISFSGITFIFQVFQSLFLIRKKYRFILLNKSVFSTFSKRKKRRALEKRLARSFMQINRNFVCVPGFYYLIPFVKGLLPFRAFLILFNTLINPKVSVYIRDDSNDRSSRRGSISPIPNSSSSYSWETQSCQYMRIVYITSMIDHLMCLFCLVFLFFFICNFYFLCNTFTLLGDWQSILLRTASKTMGKKPSAIFFVRIFYSHILFSCETLND